MSVSTIAAIKVSKDGNVTRDGVVIGRVERRLQGPGIYETDLGVSATGGKVLWMPFAADGTKLSRYPVDTRKKAVRSVEERAEPLTVTDMKVETPLGYSLSSDVKIITAWVKWQGHTCGVSRYPHETSWVVDFFAPAGSIMATFANGKGSRGTAAHVLKGEQDSAASAEAVRLGLL